MQLFFSMTRMQIESSAKIIKSLHKLFQFFFSIAPNKKDIVNISQPYKCLKFLHFKKICLSFIHINGGVWRRKFSPNTSTRDLLLNFVVKFKKKLFLRKNSSNLTRSLVGMFEEVRSSNLLFDARIPSLCGILGYRPTTSAVTRKKNLENFSYSFHIMNKISNLWKTTLR